MAIERVNTFTDQIDLLGKSEEVSQELREKAASVQSKVRAPRHLRVYTRAGVGPRGAFAQVVMSGQGALAIEFGSSKNPSYAPLRSALRGS